MYFTGFLRSFSEYKNYQFHQLIDQWHCAYRNSRKFACSIVDGHVRKYIRKYLCKYLGKIENELAAK